MAEINVTNAKSAWISPLIYGILLIVMGVLMIVFKSEALRWILIASGILLIIINALNIIIVLKELRAVAILPILYILLGVVLIVLPALMADVVMAIFAVMMILYGVLSVLGAVGDKDGNMLTLGLGVGIGILAVIVGVYALFNLKDTANIVMIVIGAINIFMGVMQVIDAFGIYRKFH